MMIAPTNVHAILDRYMLVDGFNLVLDLKKSKGCRIYDSKQNTYLLDGFSFFASSPLGCNHPKMTAPEFIKKLGEISVNNPTNSDLYTTEMAEFVDAFGNYAVPDCFHHLFFVSGGTLAIENGLKTAFDWKIRKNFAAGSKKELGTQVIHFKEAFHGRSGYTLSLTNTFNLDKTKYFPKFDWPRIINPKITFPVTSEHVAQVQDLENQAYDELDQALSYADDIAALIIEPIQGEGGDNHFRNEFFMNLRKICDEYDVMFIIDEIQSGVGITGKMWAYEHFDFKPDILAFGKKTQVCGIMVTDRVDEVKDNVFEVSSRINSTWGGNLTDMVRCQKYLEIIDDERLVNNAAVQGKRLLQGLEEIAQKYDTILTAVRGRGLMCAVDCFSPEERDSLRNKLYANGLVVLGCGKETIRFRHPLVVTEEEIDETLEIIEKTLKNF